MKNSFLDNTAISAKPDHLTARVFGWGLVFRWIVIGYIVTAATWLGLQALAAVQ